MEIIKRIALNLSFILVLCSTQLLYVDEFHWLKARFVLWFAIPMKPEEKAYWWT